MAALAGRTSQVASLLAGRGIPAACVSQAVALVAYAPPPPKLARTAQMIELLAGNCEGNNVARVSQAALLVAYATGTPDQARSRAWSYTFDGHTFYVLNLGLEGTFVYDEGTKQWAQFDTEGYDQWNMLNGTMWGTRVIAGDAIATTVHELDPTQVFDEEWRLITHVATGGVQTRSRTVISVDSFRIAASAGLIAEDGAELKLRYSDDNAETWSDYFTITLEQGDSLQELAFRSLGSFSAPGRIFELSDSGGLIRIDGCDLEGPPDGGQ